jgi:hypothetical protein
MMPASCAASSASASAWRWQRVIGAARHARSTATDPRPRRVPSLALARIARSNRKPVRYGMVESGEECASRSKRPRRSRSLTRRSRHSFNATSRCNRVSRPDTLRPCRPPRAAQQSRNCRCVYGQRWSRCGAIIQRLRSLHNPPNGSYRNPIFCAPRTMGCEGGKLFDSALAQALRRPITGGRRRRL